MHFKLTLFLFTVGFIAIPAREISAQGGALSGDVRAAESNAPIVAALVQLFSETGGRIGSTLTNQTGRFQLTGIPAGTYAVAVTTAGYSTSRQDNISLSAGQSLNLTFDLVAQAVDLDPLVVSVSRRTERALDAPARTEVVTEEEIEVRPSVTPVDHLRSVPGLDIATSGVQSTNVVARGFNNVFSGALYTLTDHRIAGVPSLRVNLLHFSSATNEDLERIEVVLGPGSALYGPGTANGVLHMLTRSPLRPQATAVTLTGGEQSLVQGGFRTAHLLSDNFGVKVSGQYLQADEWQYRDPVEVSEAAKFASNMTFWKQDLVRAAGITPAEADVRIARIGNRNFDVQRWSVDARADWQIAPDFATVLSAGTSTSKGIELTGLGAAMTEGWRSDYVQLRTNWRRVFAQAYMNQSDAGDTFLLRNGAPISDQSKLLVAQVQNATGLWGGRQDFIYGLDFIRTLPITGGSINGKYENNDETTEFGGYLQSETALSQMLDLVLAGRVDTHSALPEPIFSPRAALVFKPSQDHSFRLTYNRAFSTPTSLTQFLDLGTASPVPEAAMLGYSVRVQGTGAGGFRLVQPNGGYLIRSPFAALAGASPVTLLPAEQARAFWPAAAQAVGAQVALPAPLVQYLRGLSASSIALNYAAPSSGALQAPLSSLNMPEIARVREETSTTVEAGYRGILGERFLFAADAWWLKRENLVTPLTAATPFVHFDAASTTAFLTQALVPFFQASGNPQPAAAAAATAQQLGPGFSKVPLGVISSADINANGAQILATFFNVDEDVDLYGTDISLTALVSNELSIEGSASIVSDDVFDSSRGTRVTLNAPKRKGSLSVLYRGTRSGFNAEARVRYNAAYPVDSGVYKATACLGDIGAEVEPCVGDYMLADVNVGLELPGFSDASIQLSVQNLFNDGYRSFPGVPTIGRMAMVRLKYDMD